LATSSLETTSTGSRREADDLFDRLARVLDGRPPIPDGRCPRSIW